MRGTAVNDAGLIGRPVRPARIGTRASDLATTQTGMVAQALNDLGLATKTIHITTEGDTSRASLTALGGLGVFAARIRSGLLDGECDIAVHSAKDLPASDVPGLMIGAYPRRERPVDVLVSAGGVCLADLPAGARIGTGSPRRAAQLRRVRPDIELVDIRGNVPTRLGRVRGSDIEGAHDLDGVIVAHAGLVRLGLGGYITEELGEVLVPAGAQGALAVEIRSTDADSEQARELVRAVSSLDDFPTRLAVEAERAFLRTLGAGCSAPVGALAEFDGGMLRLHGRIVSLDGRDMLDETRTVTFESDGSAASSRRAGVAGNAREDALVYARQLGEKLGQAFLEAGAESFTDIHPAPRDTDEKTLWG